VTESTPAVSAWNIANALTVLRLVLVPVFLVLLFHNDGHDDVWRVLAFVVFAVASVTDRVDGEIARRRGIVTDFGKIADPIADKALIGAALVGLSLLGELAWWVTVVVLVREIGVTLLRFFVIRHGVMQASRGGKVKTMLQAVGIGLLVLPLGGVLHSVALLIMYAAVVVTVVTGVDYVARAVRLRRTSERTVLKRARRARAAVTLGVAQEVHELLLARGETLAVAESLTGGALAAAVVAVPGVSATFRGGVVAYATELKSELLGVDAALLAARGPVDPDVAVAMAEGVRERLGATWGLATTGVAGPDPQDGHPPGCASWRWPGRPAPGSTPWRWPATGRRCGRRPSPPRSPCSTPPSRTGTHRDDYSVTLGTRRPTGYGGDRYQPGPRRRRCPMILLRRLLGDVLREHRREQGRTLREVSAAARVSLGYLSEVERGQKEASSELLGSICEALEVPLSEVLRDVSDNLALAEACRSCRSCRRCRSPRPPRCTSPTWPHRPVVVRVRAPQRSPVHPTSTGVWTGVRTSGTLLGRQRGWQRGHQNDSRW
jgi:CDP-diacylglycerol--glycerol-3-phosphate 3-phosphatidyltransferase